MLSSKYSKTIMLGYQTYSELDCIFARRSFYVIFTMRDKFNNVVPYYDTDAFTSVISSNLSLGVIYDNNKCR